MQKKALRHRYGHAKLPPLVGVVAYRKARSTKTHVGLFRADEAGIESDPASPWATVCEEHGGVMCHRSRALAEQWLSHPEDWCPTCLEGKPS